MKRVPTIPALAAALRFTYGFARLIAVPLMLPYGLFPALFGTRVTQVLLGEGLFLFLVFDFAFLMQSDAPGRAIVTHACGLNTEERHRFPLLPVGAGDEEAESWRGIPQAPSWCVSSLDSGNWDGPRVEVPRLEMTFNPANGLPMVSDALDVHGNLFGTTSNDDAIRGFDSGGYHHSLDSCAASHVHSDF